MRSGRRGIGAAVAAMAAVVVIVVGAGAYFLVLAPGQPAASGTTGSTPVTSATPPSSTTTTSTPMAGSTTSTTTAPRSTTSSTTEASASCATSTASATGASENPLNFTALFAAYSEMGAKFNGTSQGYSGEVASDYHVLHAGASAFKVNITETATSSGEATTLAYTAWVSRNGTAYAVLFGGQNYTGTYAYDYFISAMAAYSIETTFTSPETLTALTSGLFVHETSQSSVIIGPTPVEVTSYAANQLPLMIDQCGFTSDFSQFAIQTGTVAGEATPLLAGLALDGSFSASGTTENASLTFSLTSVTEA